MIVEIKVPDLGESIQEVEIGTWTVAVGDFVHVDQPVVDVESEKATLEVPAPASGVLTEITAGQGDVAQVGDVIGRMDTSKKAPKSKKATPAKEAAAKATAAKATAEKTEPPVKQSVPDSADKKIMPSAKRVIAANSLDEALITATGPGNRVLKEDAVAASERSKGDRTHAAPLERPAANRTDQRKRMSPLRRTIAKRLLQSKQEMAILTTFNEVDMSSVKQMRAMLGEAFLEKYGVKLGFMSFFVRAAQYALKQFPLVNSMIDGDDIVYRNYVDIGVAIGGGKGLVVPVLRDVERLSLAEIEKEILHYAEKAKNNTLSPDALEGGTFTISNGGVYGSMLSTPIVNPPQSAILGLHAIKDRAVVVDGEIVVRPIMYLALSYDHRIIDGREAVSFLKAIKESIEKPAGMILEI